MFWTPPHCALDFYQTSGTVDPGFAHYRVYITQGHATAPMCTVLITQHNRSGPQPPDGNYRGPRIGLHGNSSMCRAPHWPRPRRPRMTSLYDVRGTHHLHGGHVLLPGDEALVLGPHGGHHVVGVHEDVHERVGQTEEGAVTTW